MLGTFVSISASGPDRATTLQAISAAFEEFKRADAVMSIHRADSELARVNASAATNAVVVSPELFAVLQLLADQTGLFDARAHGTGAIAVSSLGAVRIGVDRSSTLLADDGHDNDNDNGKGDGRSAAVRRAWLATISAALSTATALGNGFAWETRYDRGGSIDDGASEYPTSWGHAGPVD